MSIIVWTYWEGVKTPYIRICLRSMKNVLSKDLCIVTPQTLNDYIDPSILHPNWKNIKSIAIRSCCIRAALLATHGGFWWDADTIALQHPNILLSTHNIPRAIYTTWDKYPPRALNGYIYLIPEIAQIWLNRINCILENNFSYISWSTLGEGVLTSLLLEEKNTIHIDRSVFLPIDIDSDVKRFFMCGNPDEYITNETVCFGLNNSWFVKHKYNRFLRFLEQWSGSDLLIHKLLGSVK